MNITNLLAKYLYAVFELFNKNHQNVHQLFSIPELIQNVHLTASELTLFINRLSVSKSVILSAKRLQFDCLTYIQLHCWNRGRRSVTRVRIASGKCVQKVGEIMHIYVIVEWSTE